MSQAATPYNHFNYQNKLMMSAAKDIFDVLATLIEFIKNGYVDNANARKEFFINHIESSYQKMELIHTDYLTNLNALLKIKAKEQKTTEEIIDWLKEKKIVFQTARIRVATIEKEIFNNQYFNKAFKRDTEISKNTLQYMNDIVNYFYNGTNLQQMTWYNYLIQVFEFSLSLQQKDPNHGPVGASAIASSADIFKEINNTIGTIESQFGFISESYSNLKGLCLK